ncbi:MAG: hypothetical protein BM485_15815 [Desulfobulbaceae bacterium DB1]|nr:MAG: hypothetical protein BM485_15815 [Desulfobulbaceae bacterium DB1]
MTPIATSWIAGATIATGMVDSIRILYGTAKSINDFLNDHIEEMKRAENPTVSRTGSILEMAKFGFGIGFITPVAIIAAGQMILGNPLLAAGTIVTAPINPISMTCAAVGALYYGWGALTDQERNEMLEKISRGLEIGIEMIRSVIHYVIDKTKVLLTSKNLDEIKTYISSTAEKFGKTLYDVTKKLIDKVVDTFDKVKKTTGDAIEKTADCVSGACEAMKEQRVKAADFASGTYDSMKEHGERAVESMKSKKCKK